MEELSLLLAFYRGNGQTQGKIESQYIHSNKMVALPFTLEKDALEQCFNNVYVNRQLAKIEALCAAKWSIKTIGKTHTSYQGACTCQQPAFYLLITNYSTIDAPLTCGSCNQSVSLYQLPAYYDHGYMPILSWATNYSACDNLQMNCEVGEEWALDQMQEVDSQLSKQGLELCKKIEALTAVPTFYYLHNYRKVQEEEPPRGCPSCQQQWALKEPLLDTYDFKCDDCRVISVVSSNS